MRRSLLLILSAALCILVAARTLLPDDAAPAMNAAPRYGYNILDIDMPIAPETAGSGVIAEMNGYYLFRTPTAKNALTGALRGYNLILICADGWRADGSMQTSGALRRLEAGSAALSAVYRPDWYLGMDGREFALLSGLVPTNVNGVSSFSYAGEQDIYLPFALARALAAEGYACRAHTNRPDADSAYAALGFSDVSSHTDPALDIMRSTVGSDAGELPFFAYYVFTDEDVSSAVSYLLGELPKNTAVCLMTRGGNERHARLFLYAAPLANAVSDAPCSELDVTPTLLNLFGVDFDSRFLSGRDIFAENAVPGLAGDTTAVVSLYGSAYSDWITDQGSYTAADNLFRQAGGDLQGSSAVAAYVRDVSLLVYDRYIFARKVMENNYFHLVPWP